MADAPGSAGIVIGCVCESVQHIPWRQTDPARRPEQNQCSHHEVTRRKYSEGPPKVELSKMYSVCFVQFVKQQVRDEVAGDYKEDFDAEVSEFIKDGALGRS